MNDHKPQGYDLVGDIHGELEALVLLLRDLGYREDDEGALSHPEGRRLVFVGDLIDRGPDSRGVLHLVRKLVDSGVALAIMGNHEFNFVAYHSYDDAGEPLRSHSEGHARQVAETLRSFKGYEEEIPGWIGWMKGLPFFLDLGGLRVVHAAWVADDIAYLADKSLHDRSFLLEATRRGSRAWEAIGRVLKGPELPFPDGRRVPDANGVPRKAMRVRWWGALEGLSWAEIAFPTVPDLPEGRAELGDLSSILGYGPDGPPVFFGHYKLTNHLVVPQSAKVATLDYGLSHGGSPTAYRWGGESTVLAENYVQLPVYRLFVDDNFRFMDDEARDPSGLFFDYRVALGVAKGIVYGSLDENYEPGMSAGELMGRYLYFGESAFIVPTPEGEPYFSAREYAKAMAEEMAHSEQSAGGGES
jgi:hypothetical protein